MAFVFLRATARRMSLLLGLILCAAAMGRAQEPTPETGTTLFPGGAFVSYGSVFTTRQAPSAQTPAASLRPTFAHEGRFLFAWGFRRDFDLTILVPVATHAFHFAGLPAAPTVGGTGIGDATVTVKYRFLRRDSDRGTTQASVTFGPKLPTGQTGLRDGSGVRLPAGLQPGSGSTDLLFGLNGTYTGLFDIEKLVADGAFTYTKRTEGTQQIRLGDTAEARFWLSYRPYQTHSVDREWWLGPALTWTHGLNDAQAGNSIPGSAGDTLRLGAATFFSPHRGIHLWFSADFPVVQSHGTNFSRERHRFSFGITKQFRLVR